MGRGNGQLDDAERFEQYRARDETASNEAEAATVMIDGAQLFRAAEVLAREAALRPSEHTAADQALAYLRDGIGDAAYDLHPDHPLKMFR